MPDFDPAKVFNTIIVIVFTLIVGVLILSTLSGITCVNEKRTIDDYSQKLTSAEALAQNLSGQLNYSEEKYIKLVRENVTKQDIIELMRALNNNNAQLIHLTNEYKILNQYVVEMTYKIDARRITSHVINITLLFIIFLEIALTLFNVEFSASKSVSNFLKKLFKNIQDWWQKKKSRKNQPVQKPQEQNNSDENKKIK